MNALDYVNIDRGIHKGKLKNALNEKRKKLRGFSFSINMANFEAFRRTKKLISNLFFLKSVYPTEARSIAENIVLVWCSLHLQHMLNLPTRSNH